MTSKEATFEFLRRQQEQAGAGKNEAIREWTDTLRRLFQQFASWLGEAQSEGLLEVTEGHDHVSESGNRYWVPIIRITAVGGRRIEIAPRARFVTGGTGRVDFSSPPRDYALVRKNDMQAWEFISIADAGWKRREFSEETFWEVIRDLLS